MQSGGFHGISLILLALMLLGLQTALYMTTKQIVTGPPGVFSDEARTRNVSGTGNPWHSVFSGRCSHPRHGAGEPTNPRQKPPSKSGRNVSLGLVLELTKRLETATAAG
jgi:hypothetical protein